MSDNNDNKGNEEALLPIREIARLTGVNPVTLRAWERRYGLIKPTRTPKGHRLYSHDDVALIKEVLSWLDRGVTISKVREVLRNADESGAAAPVSDEWDKAVERAFAVIRALDENRLEALFNELTAIYPIDTVAERFLRPLLARFNAGPGGFGGCEQAFALSFFRLRLSTRLYHARRERKDVSLLVTPLPGEEHGIFGLSFALGMASAGFNVLWLDEGFPLREIGYAAPQSGADACVLYGDSRISVQTMDNELARLAAIPSVNMAVAGQCQLIQGEELRERRIPILPLNPAEAAQALRQLIVEARNE